PPTANVDDAAGAMVDKERGTPPADIYARWRTGVDTLLAKFRAADPSERVQWVAGTVSVQTLATTRLAETWIHTGDVASGLGVDLPSTDRLKSIARLAWRTLPYAFVRAGREMQGKVAFELTPPNGTETWVFADGAADTVVRGPVRQLCEVAAQRADAAETSLTAEGPDAEGVLALVRTFA
ncbi:MAG TPA: maleylpyruvate isomerase family mycothiol-dependent enzyme, partial [Acidimicrobiales bacterium]|nr:maleylpyruvate isomerase family mycothiol-dependent enzyme [Acidimicrobiales bacterium]